MADAPVISLDEERSLRGWAANLRASPGKCELCGEPWSLHTTVSVIVTHSLILADIQKRKGSLLHKEDTAKLDRAVAIIVETFMHRAGETIEREVVDERARQAVQIAVAEGLLR